MDRTKIPPSIIGRAATILAEAYTHSELNALFLSAGFPGDTPLGSKVDKCIGWLRRANNECPDPLIRFGLLIAEFMDQLPEAPWNDPWEHQKETIRSALASEELSYQRRGTILGSSLTGPSRSLREQITADGVAAIEREFQRAYENVESDPGAAVTAGCAILEAVCKTYLEEAGEPLPDSQTLKPLWNATARSLGLNPKAVADEDLRRVISGMFSVADGIGSLRTHEGSAHGRASSATYRLEPRHARLAVHASHTLAHFILETWKKRKA